MNIIIDGYNLIRQSETLQPYERQSLEAGRKELIRKLVEYNKLRGHSVTIVFDGWQGGKEREERYRDRGILVIYSRIGEQADEVIKRLVHQTRGEETLVVTSDREIASTAERAGSVSLTSPEFEARLTTVWKDDEFFDDADEYDYRSDEKKKGPARKLSRKKRLSRKLIEKL